MKIGGLFINKKLLILLVTLCFILSIFIVSASDDNSTNENTDNLTINDQYYQKVNENRNYQSVSKSINFPNFSNLFNFNNGYGYWVWSSDMYKVDFDKLEKNGVKYIFLNSYAFTEHGQREVLDWIKEANAHGIEVHIWMQIFNTGEWISPLKNGTPNISYFNYKIEEARYYAGLEGVSGILIDYVRFKGNAYKYENGSEAITLFVKMFSTEMRKVNPNLKLSMTVMPEGDKDNYYYGQNVPVISQYVDVIIPMMYKGNYKENSTWIENTTEWFVKNSKAEVWCGIQTYKSDFNTTALPASEITKDANLCFKGGAKGVVLFKWGMNKAVDDNKLKID